MNVPLIVAVIVNFAIWVLIIAGIRAVFAFPGMALSPDCDITWHPAAAADSQELMVEGERIVEAEGAGISCEDAGLTVGDYVIKARSVANWDETLGWLDESVWGETLSLTIDAGPAETFPPSCTVEWDPVDHAMSYILSVNGEEHETSQTFVACADVGMVHGSTYLLKVRAISSGSQSDWSARIQGAIVDSNPPLDPILPPPTNMRATDQGPL